MSRNPQMAIVGGGITGLCLAHSLRRHGILSCILDKGRSPGGRLATLVRDDVPIDFGPGWFHTDDAHTAPEIQGVLRTLQSREIAANDLPDDVRKRLPACDRIRSWHVPGGIRRIAERLADSLDVLLCHHVRRIERTPSGWRISGTVSSEQDRAFSREASALVLTQPWPQVLELLESSGLGDLSVPVIDAEERHYERVMALIFECEDFPLDTGPAILGKAAGIDPIRSVRLQPEGLPGHVFLTIFAEPRWCVSHWHDPDQAVLGHLLEALESRIGQSLRATLIRLHRWKYARLADPAFGCAGPSVLSAEPLAIAAGEAFGVTPESPAGLLSAQASARLAASILREWRSGLPGR